MNRSLFFASSLVVFIAVGGLDSAEADQKAAIEAIILGAAPHGKPGVTKAFTAGQPSETWDAKNGRWTYSVTWNYELNTSKYY